MKNLIGLFLLLPVFLFSQYGIQDSTVAFQGAQGGGAKSLGGRGRALHIVDDLSTSTTNSVYHPADCNVGGHSHTLPLGNAEEFYTGSFFSTLENYNVGYYVYNKSGVIYLPLGNGNTNGTSRLFRYQGIWAHDKTIFGQSAPRGGITFTNGILRFGGYTHTTDGDNLIIRYIRSRPIFDKTGTRTRTDDASTWGIHIYGGDNVIVDHCSATWAQDKAAGSYIVENHTYIGATMIGQTWSNNIFGDSNTATYTSINPNRDGDPEEYVDQISWLRNLIIGANRTPNMAFDGDGEVYNNVIFNIPTKYTRSYHDIRLNLRGNYYKEYSSTYEFNWAGEEETIDVPRVHGSGNYLVGTISREEYSATVNYTGVLTQDNRALWSSYKDSPVTNILNAYYTSTPHDFSSWSNSVLTTPQVAYEELITNGNVGANKYIDNNGVVQTYQDDIDLWMINAVRNNTNFVSDASNWYLPSLPQNTRPANYDTDWDGMADAWEIAVFGDLDESYSGDWDGDGVPNIEEFMGQVDVNTVTPVINVTDVQWNNNDQTVQVGGILNLTYEITPSNADNQTVTYTSSNTSVISNSGAIMGTGTATLTITTNDGSFTDTMNINVIAAPTPVGRGKSRNKKKFFIINK